MMKRTEKLRHRVWKFGALVTLLLLAVFGVHRSDAQIGHGTLGPIKLTTSDADHLTSARIEIDSIPQIETAEFDGPAWYSGQAKVAVAVFAAGSTRPGYALQIVRTNTIPSGAGGAVIPVSVKDDVINETTIEGCASRTGEGGVGWISTQSTAKQGLNLPTASIQPVRFC